MENFVMNAGAQERAKIALRKEIMVDSRFGPLENTDR